MLFTDLNKLSIRHKKILIDYMSELIIDDKIKVLKQFDSFIRDIINENGIRTVYVVNGSSDNIWFALRGNPIEIKQIDIINEEYKHKLSFQSEYLSIKNVLKTIGMPNVFDTVLVHSSDSLRQYGYSDKALATKLYRVAKIANKLYFGNESMYPKYKKDKVIAIAVENICAYIIKSNLKIKEVFVSSYLDHYIKNEDPIFILFKEFINSKKCDINIGLSCIETLFNRIDEDWYEIKEMIEWLFGLYSTIQTDVNRYIQKNNIVNLSDDCGNNRFYRYKATSYFGRSIDENDLTILVNKAINYEKKLRENGVNLNFNLNEKQKAALMTDFPEFGFCSVTMINENDVWNDWIILVNQETDDSYLLYTESTNSKQINSRVEGFSLSDDKEKSKNKIVFEDLDICSEYEIILEN